MKTERKHIPIGFCPSCGRAVLYAADPQEKRYVIVRIAEEDYRGKTVLCAKCKAMLAVIEKPHVATGYIAVPIVTDVR